MNLEEKKSLAKLILILVLIIAITTISTIIINNTVFRHTEDLVYRTKTGNCYHSPECGYLWNSAIAMGYEQAKESSLHCCSRCGGESSGTIEVNEYVKAFAITMGIEWLIVIVLFVGRMVLERKNDEGRQTSTYTEPTSETAPVKPITDHTDLSPKTAETFNIPSIRLWEYPEHQAVLPVIETPTILEPDENTPKSMPKNEKDRYIRKRMNVAGLYYGDSSAVAKLKAGDYLDFVAEPNNPHDRNAVAIYLDGAKIGYVARTDAPPIAAAIRLGRSLYGVVTDIVEKNGKKTVEYEAWMTLNV